MNSLIRPIEKHLAQKNANPIFIHYEIVRIPGSLLPRANANLLIYTQRARQYYGFNVIQQVPTTVDAETYVEANIGVPVQYVDTIDDVVRAATATA